MRMHLKLVIVAAGIKHQFLAVQANRHLPPEQHLFELNITRLVICSRKDLTPEAYS